MKLVPYLHFDGQAAEAINFYAAALDATIDMVSRFRESPLDVPEGHLDRVMHAQLSFGENSLMLCDAMPGQPPASGSQVTLALNLRANEDLARRLFERLADGGRVTMPLGQQFWGALFGMCVDRYGVSWMVNCQNEPPVG